MSRLIEIHRHFSLVHTFLIMHKIRFIPICLIVLAMAIGVQVFAQEVHGYGMVIANDLSDHNFLVTSHGYASDSSYLYVVRMETPEFYDEELARMTISNELSQYRDVKRIEPWSRSGGWTESTYRINDSELTISIYENSEDSYGLPRGCVLHIYEFINPDWKKAKSTSKKKATKKKSGRKR